MATASDNAQPGTAHRYRAMRDFLQSMDDTLPRKFEITKEGIVHDLISPNAPHELTVLRVRRDLENVMPGQILAHTGKPDVENEPDGIMRHPDIMVIAWTDLDTEASIDPRIVIAAVEVVSRSTRTTTGSARCVTTR